MTRTSKMAASLAIAGALAARAALANPTPVEFRCELAMGKALTRWQNAATRCISKCEKGATEGESAFTHCDPPYGGAARSCIDAASARVVPAVTAGCAGACPACYANQSGDCPGEAERRLGDARSLFDALVPFVACEELTPSQHAEILCTRTVAKSINKLIDGMLKCYSQCYERAAAGEISGATCAGFPSDQATSTCINVAGARGIANIDRKCFAPGRTAPSCYAGLSGGSIVNTIEFAGPGLADPTFCGFE